MDERNEVKKQKKIKYFDYSLLIIILTVVFFGLVMLYSTSSYNGQLKFGDNAYFLKKQLIAVAVGIVGMLLTTLIPYRVWDKLSFAIYLLSIVLCIAVLFIGRDINGSKRWIYFGSVSFQPSELAKIAVILYLASVICRHDKHLDSLKNISKILLRIAPLFLVVAYENLSTGIIIAGIAFVMLFVASPKYSHFLWIIVIAAGAMGAFLLVASYRVERIRVWLHPEDYERGYQTLQGLYAIGSGGVFGKGLGESMQKLGFVPEAQNDMIFTIICEELGLFGAACVILMFILMLWRFMIIANNAPDLYGTLIVVGILAHIALQVLLNIAVVTNTIPNTGIILPFISYGGTSISILLAEMGLALSVSRGIVFEG